MPVNIRHSLAPLADKDLQSIETKFGVRLPDEYRQFLLRHNGGVPQPDYFRFPELGNIKWFLSIGRDNLLDPEWCDWEGAFAKLKGPQSTLPARLVPIAEVWTMSNPGCLSDYLCVSVDGPDRGQVFFWRDIEGYRSKVPEPVATSFDGLLAGLYSRGGQPLPKWMVLVQDGDVQGLRQWLNTGGSIKATDSYDWTVADHAIEEGRWEILQLLLERGASVTKAFAQAVERRRYGIARKLLPLGVKTREVQTSLARHSRYFWRDIALIRALVDAGADVNHVDRQVSHGNRPLHLAAAAGQLPAVQLLLEHGAKPDALNKAGRRAADEASKAGYSEIVDLLSGTETKTIHQPSSMPDAEARDINLHGVRMPRSGKLPTVEQLAAWEAKLGRQLPAQYRAFLLQHNGGLPQPNRFRVTSEDAEEMQASITQFYSLSAGGKGTGEEDLAFMWNNAAESGLPEGLLPIAQVEDWLSGGVLAISVQGKDRGQIY
jgi:hypothetical protein